MKKILILGLFLFAAGTVSAKVTLGDLIARPISPALDKCFTASAKFEQRLAIASLRSEIEAAIKSAQVDFMKFAGDEQKALGDSAALKKVRFAYLAWGLDSIKIKSKLPIRLTADAKDLDPLSAAELAAVIDAKLIDFSAVTDSRDSDSLKACRAESTQLREKLKGVLEKAK